MAAVFDLSAIAPEFIVTEGNNTIYIPKIDVEQFWLRRRDYTLLDVNAENKTTNTTFIFDNLWYMKFMLENGIRNQGKLTEKLGEFGLSNVAEEGRDMEEIKEMVLEANPILLGVTFLVHMLHSVFEFLALKNGKFSIQKDFLLFSI